jgi:hypothetical protein
VTDGNPAGNWLRMHRGWGEQPKVRHRTWLGAWWHLRWNQRHPKARADLMWVYPCWFTDQNTFGRKHFHVGHMRHSRKPAKFGAPVPGKLYAGVFAVQDGYEVRTFRTSPPECHPVQPSVIRALQQYLEDCAEADDQLGLRR